MNGATITMPLREYEKLNKEIERLEKESIRTCIDREYTNLAEAEWFIKINDQKLKELIKSIYGRDAINYEAQFTNEELVKVLDGSQHFSIVHANQGDYRIHIDLARANDYTVIVNNHREIKMINEKLFTVTEKIKKIIF